MTLALEARALKNDLLIADTPKAQRRESQLRGLKPRRALWKHAKFADVEGVLTPAEMSQMLVFTLVRNPWDRMVSYYHWLRAQPSGHGLVERAKTVGFATFLHDPMTRVAVRENHYATYVKPAKNPVFVRLEHLEEDLAPVEAHLGFRPRLPDAGGAAQARDWRRYYSDIEAELVGEICSGDIQRFGYRYDVYA